MSWCRSSQTSVRQLQPRSCLNNPHRLDANTRNDLVVGADRKSWEGLLAEPAQMPPYARRTQQHGPGARRGGAVGAVAQRGDESLCTRGLHREVLTVGGLRDR